MAMKKTRNIKGSGVAVTDAYNRIKALRFDHPDRIYVQVGTYENETSDVVLDSVEYTLSVTDDFNGKENVSAAQAYAKLKQMDEWSDAEDV